MLVALLVAALVGAAVLVTSGGGGGKDDGQVAVENAIEDHFAGSDSIRVGLNANGLLVGVRQELVPFFSQAADVESVSVDEVKVKGDEAVAPVSLSMASGTDCRGRLALRKEEGKWDPMVLAVTSCR